jgi:ferritin-like metal-binding protein YciE
MVATEKTLTDAFYETLKDVYYAEKQSVRALTKSAKLAKLPDLKRAFEDHRDESARQVERLEQVFEAIGKPARTKTCEAMQGLVHEMQEDLEDFGDSPAADAVLIGCAQAVEHYEIARYGLLKTWAKQLNNSAAVDLLDATLQEEKAADARLTQIAETSANAGSGPSEPKPSKARPGPAAGSMSAAKQAKPKAVSEASPQASTAAGTKSPKAAASKAAASAEPASPAKTAKAAAPKAKGKAK